MVKDYSRVVVLGILLVCFLIIGGAIYFLWPPSTSETANQSPAVSVSPGSDVKTQETQDAYKDWVQYVYAPTATSLKRPPDWQVQEFDASSAGQIAIVRQPGTRNQDVYSVTLSANPLLPPSTVVEVMPITLNSGKTASLVYVRNTGAAEANVTDVVVASGNFEVGQEIRAAALSGVGTSSVYVAINLLPSNATSNPGRAREAFASAGFDQALKIVKTIQKK